MLRSRPAQCEECHAGKIPTSIAHASSTIDVAFGGRAMTGGAAPSYDAATGCSATYCHGNYSGVYTYDVWDWGCDGGRGLCCADERAVRGQEATVRGRT